MPTIRFTADHEDRRSPRYALDYKAGTVAFVHRSCADAALKAGRAVMVRDRFAPDQPVSEKDQTHDRHR